MKVWGSEALAFAADEGVQIHGGYGFVEEYPIERVYRDNRVYRIFEGTNEINRMLVPGTMLRRATKGAFPIAELAARVDAALAGGAAPDTAGPLGREQRVAELNKCLFAYALQVAVEALGPAVADAQEVLGALADVAIETFAVDSAVARALQHPDPVGEACVTLYSEEAHARAYARARAVVMEAVKERTAARYHLERLRKLLDESPCDLGAWREVVVARTVERGGYPLAWT